MIKYFYWILISVLIVLAGCRTPIVGPNIEEKNCINRCLHQFQYCEKICVQNCNNCCIESKLRAKASYSRYLRQCEIDGSPPIQRLQSFTDPLKCNKTSCNCHTDLTLCKQSCLGKVYKSLKPYKFC